MCFKWWNDSKETDLAYVWRSCEKSCKTLVRMSGVAFEIRTIRFFLGPSCCHAKNESDLLGAVWFVSYRFPAILGKGTGSMEHVQYAVHTVSLYLKQPTTLLIPRDGATPVAPCPHMLLTTLLDDQPVPVMGTVLLPWRCTQHWHFCLAFKLSVFQETAVWECSIFSFVWWPLRRVKNL
jgi:hypothetical protein